MTYRISRDYLSERLSEETPKVELSVHGAIRYDFANDDIIFVITSKEPQEFFLVDKLDE